MPQEIAALRAALATLRAELAELRDAIGEMPGMECGITGFAEWRRKRKPSGQGGRNGCDGMGYLIFALVVAFVAVNVFVEAVNQGPSKWWRDPLSHYLVGVEYAWLQRLGYLGLAAAECLMIATGYAWPESVALGVAAFGLVGVVVTKFPFALRWPGRATRTWFHQAWLSSVRWCSSSWCCRTPRRSGFRSAR